MKQGTQRRVRGPEQGVGVGVKRGKERQGCAYSRIDKRMGVAVGNGF